MCSQEEWPRPQSARAGRATRPGRRCARRGGRDSARGDRRARRAARTPEAPAMSSSRLSPTITASSAGAPPRASAAAKIVVQGLRRPCAREASAKSTAIPSCAANGSSSRSVLETRPTVQPDDAQALEQRLDIGEELEVAGIAPGLLGCDADLLGLVAAGAHPAHDLDREAAMLSAAVLERARPSRCAGRRAGPARSGPGRAGHRSGHRAPCSRGRRTRGADGST